MRPRRLFAVVVLAVAVGGLFAGWTVAKPGDTKLVRTNGRAMPKNWQRWADRSLVPTVKGRVTVHLTGCPVLPKAAGCVFNNRPRDVYVRRGVRRVKSVFRRARAGSDAHPYAGASGAAHPAAAAARDRLAAELVQPGP